MEPGMLMASLLIIQGCDKGLDDGKWSGICSYGDLFRVIYMYDCLEDIV